MSRKIHHIIIASAGLALVAGAVGCSTDNGTVATTTDYAYEDAYLYTGYYPADVAYASYAWAYPWDYGAFYYLGSDTVGVAAAYTGTGGSGGTGGGGGSGTGTGTVGGLRSGLASAIEALARGDQLCPGQVTVTEKMAAPACQGSNATQQRAGVSIAFNGCAAPGGTINGTVDVQSNLSASEQTCSANTILTLGHTSTFTNLSITVADGRKLLIPNETNTGMTTFGFGQTPTKTDINANGELQIFDSSGTMRSDLTFSGDNSYTFSGNQSYTVSGTTNVKEKNGNATATVTRQGLVRSGDCCRPTSGTISVNRTGGTFPGQANWAFGPSCGQVQRNNTTATMPTCM